MGYQVWGKKKMSYPSDLTDAQWEVVRPNFEYTNGYGNQRKHSIRVMINAILYVVKTGCQWRQLPNDFPYWKSVYSYYRRLCKRGTWEKALDDLNQKDRVKRGREPTPSYVIIDSQSVKTTAGGEKRGYDGGKNNQRSKTSHRRWYRRSFVACRSHRGQLTRYNDGMLYNRIDADKIPDDSGRIGGCWISREYGAVFRNLIRYTGPRLDKNQRWVCDITEAMDRRTDVRLDQ